MIFLRIMMAVSYLSGAVYAWQTIPACHDLHSVKRAALAIAWPVGTALLIVDRTFTGEGGVYIHCSAPPASSKLWWI